MPFQSALLETLLSGEKEVILCFHILPRQDLEHRVPFWAVYFAGMLINWICSEQSG